MPSVVLFSLLTLTYGGAMAHSDGYPGRPLCEAAKAMALRSAETGASARSDAFLRGHPPRVPRDGLEGAFLSSGLPVSKGLSPELRRVDAGHVREMPPSEVAHDPTDVRIAECVPDDAGPDLDVLVSEALRDPREALGTFHE